jgi:hypothetical protein
MSADVAVDTRVDGPASEWVSDTGIVLPRQAAGVLTVSFDGRYVWSFQPARDAVPTRHGLRVDWPTSLLPHLNGTTRVTVTDHHTGRAYVDEQVALGEGGAPLRLEDAHGHPLAVNKVGNLTRVFSETHADARREILEGTVRVLDDLRDHGGVAAFLNYGCLLGAVREGRMIGTDCDADVCYLSEQPTPADVVAESYRLERAMLARGWPTVRMSAGDFKVVLKLDDGRRCYVDVFVAFYVGDTFYQLGNRSGRLPRDAVVPTSTITLEGVEFPAPADPEAMLAFVYGPTWRVPDPAFRFSDPPAGVRRLDGWLRGFRDEVPAWNELYRSTRAREIPKRGSDFARWVRSRIAAGDTVADLGCGLGRDARFFAKRGHPVLAYDVSPDARRTTQRKLRRAGSSAVVRRLMLGELRTVALTAAEVAHSPSRRHVYARHLVGCVDDESRRNLWRLARSALRGSDGTLFLEFAAVSSSTPETSAPEPAGLVRRLDADAIVRELAAYGGRVLAREEGRGSNMFDDPDDWTCRLQVGFDTGGDEPDA